MKFFLLTGFLLQSLFVFSQTITNKKGDVFNINNGYAFKSGDYVKHGVPILRTRDYSKTKWIKIDQPIYISETYNLCGVLVVSLMVYIAPLGK